tara:strand:+ start:614 stop:1855 length:1242 start_codon:yes stop_codon:yes gene_type:complete
MIKKKKKLFIVGSGITGLSAALIAIKKNISAEIFETGPIAGGIIKDTIVNDQNYLTGCQYLSKNSFWYDHVPKKIKNLLKETKVIYSTYCDLFNNKNKCLDNYPDLFLDKKIKIKSLKYKKPNSLMDRCLLYPTPISKILLNWIKRFDLKSNKLMQDSNRNGLMFSRIFLKKNLEITNLKKKSKIFDDLYGTPRLKKNNLEGLLPKYGYNKFFGEFLKYLEKNKIKIHLKTPVIPIWKKNKISLKIRGKIFKPNYVLWTGNPVSLIKNYNSQMLDSVNFKIRILTFKVIGNIKEDFYVQVFTKKSSILRLFFYIKDKKKYCSVECFNEKEDIKKIKKMINKILFSLKIKISLEDKQKSDIIQKRYSLLSVKDYKILKNFKKRVSRSNLIPSPWEYSSSQKKLMLLKSSMKRVI